MFLRDKKHQERKKELTLREKQERKIQRERQGAKNEVIYGVYLLFHVNVSLEISASYVDYVKAS